MGTVRGGRDVQGLAADSPVYVEQFICSIAGPLDVDLFRRAWEQVIDRHGALRTAFFWTGVEQPLQVVFSHVDAPWAEHDWRGLSVQERRSRLEGPARRT